MESHVKDIMRESTKASDEERAGFAEIVKKLIDVGVERYHADLVRSEKTYYLPDGESLIVPNDPVGIVPALEFSAAGVEMAVKAIQAGTIKYREFCKRAMSAGCVGYVVSMAGKRVVYYGRTGDSHVEWFPGAK
jgi:uncharacterized protein YbcV (DUF1398 family)